MVWVVHDEGEIGDEYGFNREGVLADCGWDGGGVEQGYRSHTRDPLHLSYGCLVYVSVLKCLCNSRGHGCLDFKKSPERRADVACPPPTLFLFQAL